jgi:polypyrimidine tract-binding protein 2
MLQAAGPRPGFHQQAGGSPQLGMNSYQVQLGGASAAASVFGGVLPPGITGTNDRSTLLASNLLPEKIDAQKLFNLFSNYGNIVRVKVLHNKPDHALIQMGDGLQAELAFNYLKMDINFSKHAQINPSPETTDFSSSPLNHFNHNAAKNYRYCCAPTKMIHVSSLPANITKEDITAHLSPHGNIINSKIFESNGKKQVLLLFENEDEATEALVCKHASELQNCNIRLAFSNLASV